MAAEAPPPFKIDVANPEAAPPATSPRVPKESPLVRLRSVLRKLFNKKAKAEPEASAPPPAAIGAAEAGLAPATTTVAVSAAEGGLSQNTKPTEPQVGPIGTANFVGSQSPQEAQLKADAAFDRKAAAADPLPVGEAAATDGPPDLAQMVAPALKAAETTAEKQ